MKTIPPSYGDAPFDAAVVPKPLMRHLGRALAAVYGDVAAAPLPPRLQQLVTELTGATEAGGQDRTPHGS